MKFASRTFLLAGIYGLVVLLPQYVLEPAGLSHPELFYGFIALAAMWQVMFIAISRDVVRYRPLMLVAAGEKLLFAASIIALVFLDRLAPFSMFMASIDVALGLLFAVSYASLGGSRRSRAPATG